MNRARKTLSAVVAAAMLFVLSGCVVFEMDLSVDEELNVSGTAGFAIEVAALADTGMTPQELLGDAEEEFGANDLPPGATMTPIDDGELYGFEIKYDNVSQAEVDFGSDGTAMFAKDGDTIVFNLEHPFYEADTDVDPDDPFGGMMTGSMMLTTGHLAITFPGEIIEAPGATISGNTATWDLKTFSEQYVTAQANIGGGGIPWLTIALIAVVIIALAAIIGGVLVMRKKKNASSPGAPDAGFAAPVAGSAPQGYAPQDPQYGQPVAPEYGQPQAPQFGESSAPEFGQPVAPAYGQPAPEAGEGQPQQNPPAGGSPVDGENPQQ